MRIGLIAVATVAACALASAVQAGRHALVPVPTSLKLTESSVEDIVDSALSRDRRIAIETAANLRASAGDATAALRRAHVQPALIADFNRRVNRLVQLARTGSFIGIALAANDVSELMYVLFARFRDRVPAEVLKLDYLDREAHLRSLARQPKRVTIAIKQLWPTWATVRLKVVAAGGVKEATAYHRHVAAMNRLAPGAGLKLQLEAVRGLALVDDLERVFVR